ncbi:MAG: helix-turn-helix transcriptional regulator [Deltaproteobacteria bacterium]|nr:helix-turn-helix transcriptional regulator [Deltaproteobacteria bacterium]
MKPVVIRNEVNTPDKILYGSIAARIRQARESKGLKQIELASMTEVSRASIANMECGRQNISISTLYKIAKACTVSLHDLLPHDSLPEGETIPNDVKRKLKTANLSERTIKKIIHQYQNTR